MITIAAHINDTKIQLTLICQFYVCVFNQHRHVKMINNVTPHINNTSISTWYTDWSILRVQYHAPALALNFFAPNKYTC